MAAMTQKIVLFDIANKLNRCTSPNTWKTRFALNLKGLEYETKWMEPGDITPLFKELGIPEAPLESFFRHTCPAIRTEDGKYIMGSETIAPYLESKYPAPKYRPFHYDNPIVKRAEAATFGLFVVMGPIFFRLAGRSINDVTYEGWHARACAIFGVKNLSDMDPMGGEVGWAASQEAIANLIALLKEHEGPFTLGKEPSFADAYLVGFMCIVEVAREGILERLLSHDKVLEDFWKGVQPWLNNNGQDAPDATL